MGNRPKPTKLKIVQGNPGKRPINVNEPEPERGIPDMPEWLKPFPVAVKEWERESKILDDMGVLTVAECGTLAMRCYVAEQIQDLAAEIQIEGKTITLTQLNKNGEEVANTVRTNPKCVQLKNLLTEYRQIGGLLGLDPVNRTRIKTEPKKPKDEAEEFLRGRK